MGTRLSAQDASAYEALDRLLFREWDPIGVYPNENLADEYRTYLPQFWALAKAGAPAEDLAAYLGRIEQERITVVTSEVHRLDIARKAALLLQAWATPVRP